MFPIFSPFSDQEVVAEKIRNFLNLTEEDSDSDTSKQQEEEEEESSRRVEDVENLGPAIETPVVTMETPEVVTKATSVSTEETQDAAKENLATSASVSSSPNDDQSTDSEDSFEQIEKSDIPPDADLTVTYQSEIAPDKEEVGGESNV